MLGASLAAAGLLVDCAATQQLNSTSTSAVSVVAPILNLRYRRIAFGTATAFRESGGLQIRDTPEYNSALRQGPATRLKNQPAATGAARRIALTSEPSHSLPGQGILIF